MNGRCETWRYNNSTNITENWKRHEVMETRYITERVSGCWPTDISSYVHIFRYIFVMHLSVFFMYALWVSKFKSFQQKPNWRWPTNVDYQSAVFKTTTLTSVGSYWISRRYIWIVGNLQRIFCVSRCWDILVFQRHFFTESELPLKDEWFYPLVHNCPRLFFKDIEEIGHVVINFQWKPLLLT